MTTRSSSLESPGSARKHLDLLLALTREETFSRAQDDTLRADKCYYLRQTLLEIWADQGLGEDPAFDWASGEDPCDVAQRLLASIQRA